MFHRLIRLAVTLSLLGSLLTSVGFAVALPAAASGAVSTEPPYWIANAQGHVWSFGGAVDLGDLRGTSLNKPIVGMTPTPSKLGYWMVATDGGIFAYGDARFLGSTGSIRLNQPIVAMAATSTNNGYWMVARDGGIFAYGDARFFGSTGSIRLNQPIVAMASTPTGNGYWMVARDGGIFAFGDARFFGSTGGIKLNKPIVAMAPTPSGNGYWLVANDGGIFAFGDAKFFGSAGGALGDDFAEIVAAPNGQGYWLLRKSGDTLAFGSATIASGIGRQIRPAVALFYDIIGPGDIAVAYAMRQVGKAYLWGGNGPDAYDCSGLTSQAWQAGGASIARVANDQYNSGRRIPLDQMRPGDLLFWGPDRNNERSIDHVGMYVGGGWAVNAGGTGTGVNMRSVPKTAGWMFPYAVRPRD